MKCPQGPRHGVICMISDSWVVKINLGHLVKSEWEEELSTAVMGQFGRDWSVFVEFTELRVRIVGPVGRLPCVFL